jgi:glycosyltransferase involved in cell wall biosynthesis
VEKLSRQQGSTVVLHYWGHRGGGSQVTLSLARHLRAARPCLNIILSLNQQNKDMRAFEEDGFPIIAIDRPNLSDLWRKAWVLPRDLKRHADSLEALKPAAVIMTMNSPFAWPFIRMLQGRGLKVFYVTHDAEPHPGDYARLWQRVSQDLLIKTADRVITLSNSVARRIIERLPAIADRTTAIPLETIYRTERRHQAVDLRPGESVRLLFYGRLLPYKGLNLLADALEPLRDDPNWRMTIAGSGPLETDVKRMFAGWSQVDLELGWIADQRTAELFSSHHLLLCPYIEASQSGVIAQAMSWAMPSLVMPAGALPEQIGFGKAGLVAEALDAEGLSRALKLVLEKPSCIADLSQGTIALHMERQSNQGWFRLIETAALHKHKG